MIALSSFLVSSRALPSYCRLVHLGPTYLLTYRTYVRNCPTALVLAIRYPEEYTRQISAFLTTCLRPLPRDDPDVLWSQSWDYLSRRAIEDSDASDDDEGAQVGQHAEEGAAVLWMTSCAYVTYTTDALRVQFSCLSSPSLLSPLPSPPFSPALFSLLFLTWLACRLHRRRRPGSA